jgi:hypothetical protein
LRNFDHDDIEVPLVYHYLVKLNLSDVQVLETREARARMHDAWEDLGFKRELSHLFIVLFESSLAQVSLQCPEVSQSRGQSGSILFVRYVAIAKASKINGVA